jgi:hypothetical protein
MRLKFIVARFFPRLSSILHTSDGYVELLWSAPYEKINESQQQHKREPLLLFLFSNSFLPVYAFEVFICVYNNFIIDFFHIYFHTTYLYVAMLYTRCAMCTTNDMCMVYVRLICWRTQPEETG